jgi:hypothetical protein
VLNCLLVWALADGDASFSGGGTLVTFVLVTKESSLQPIYIDSSYFPFLARIWFLIVIIIFPPFTIYMFYYDTPFSNSLSGTASLHIVFLILFVTHSLRKVRPPASRAFLWHSSVVACVLVGNDRYI